MRDEQTVPAADRVGLFCEGAGFILAAARPDSKSVEELVVRISWRPVCLSVIAGSVLALALVPLALAETGGLQLEIHEPGTGLVVPSQQTSIQVEGQAEILGGLRNLDLFLVLDTSKSLRKSDPNDDRASGAVGLVRSLLWSDVHVGLVDFDRKTQLVSPLTGDLTAVMKAIRGLDQKGASDFSDGIRAALKGFDQSGRPGSARLMLVFSDGKLDEEDVRKAMTEARTERVSISTLAFGADESGEAILRELAHGTGGSFVAVTDPAQLPEAFLNLRTTGIERVELRVNESAPLAAQLAGKGFSVEVPLVLGENRLVAKATSFDGREREMAITVTVRSPGCAELQVRAESGGKPALSISRRGVEIVVDASGSMWGRMDGRTKIEIAKEILGGALDWLPADLNLSLRAYGHQYDRREANCEDTELLVAPGAGNRAEIRSAIDGLIPKGQTPLAYALGQVSADFDGFEGERAVVLVTDGIESCGEDAAGAARALQQESAVPVHVIGFGLDGKTGEDLASLRAIAEASGGKFLSAGNAAELRRALSTTVGTPYSVWHENVRVGQGTLGADESIRLPAGEYRLQLDSEPGYDQGVSLASEELTTLVLQREGDQVVPTSNRSPTGYVDCEVADSKLLSGEGPKP